MSISKKLNIQEFLDSSAFGGFHRKILFLGFLVLVLDGFDVVAMGFVGPSIVAEWKLTASQLGPVLSMGLFGLAIGALTGGPLADRLGRRKVIIGACLFFGVMSLASAWSPDIHVLAAMRFLTGLGLGASQPNTATLASEYAPKKYRATMVTVIYCGFTLGAAGGGFLASYLLQSHAWTSILVVGGVVPIIFAIALLWILPESAKFLALRHSGHSALELIVNRIAPGTADASTEFVTPEHTHKTKNPIRLVVAKQHRIATFSLWIGLFMNLMTVYFLNSWLPIMVKDNHFTLIDAAKVGAMMNVGGTIGNVVIGWEMDRFKPHKVLIGTLIGAAVFTVAIALTHPGLYGLIVLVSLLGYCTNSSNTGWTALAASYYPTEIRATGTSWMTGIGRFGAIFGASVGAVLLSFHWEFGQLFLALNVPIGIAIMAACVKGGRSVTSEPVISNAPVH